MGLGLEFCGREFGFEAGSEECHAIDLVGIQTEAHPDEVNVIGHEAVDRAGKSFARGCVKQEFAEGLVKGGSEPALGSVVES